MVRGTSSSHDGSGLHPYAKRAPKPQKSSDPVVVVQQDEEYDAFVEVVDSMCKDRPVAIQLRNFLRKSQKKGSAEAVGPEIPFPDSYAKFDRLPTYWMAAHIESVTEGQITKSLLLSMEQVQHGITRVLFHSAHGTTDADYWPRGMLVKSVLSKNFRLRYAFLGFRLRDFKSTYLSPDNAVKLSFSPYIFTFNDAGVMTAIRHRDGAQGTIKPHQVVTRAFHPDKLWSDAAASFSLDGTSYTLSMFFEAPAGPWKYILDKKSSALANIADEATVQDPAHASFQEDSTFAEDLKRTAKQASLTKARETAKARKKSKPAVTLEGL
mmetsp:Transcript_6333/g.15627  ORF Transcript_6333/g.15627 Transcript_6333/m.15627 type:complete len:323 (-) Transcript_6333:203-1171(-)|eukprot:CAMPEP_0115481970 /NCGR_PEP_ID=MMETSP0271-20121206/58087_1 /TAXON_ID=71861 /ORGANISM="Scrippsiella trochoidea, Strain CCMP3099" /LENGTH=322 /DNA_ID=CAMNT_0002909751 /DNA_START=62 /DNA_END=1030 /DNA_ORIENTATION=-